MSGSYTPYVTGVFWSDERMKEFKLEEETRKAKRQFTREQLNIQEQYIECCCTCKHSEVDYDGGITCMYLHDNDSEYRYVSTLSICNEYEN